MTSSRPKRGNFGMKICWKQGCETCDFVKEGKTLKATATDTIATINSAVDCTTENYIYLITCKKCRLQYVGKSNQKFASRMSQHRNYVINKQLQKSTGEHFNRRGHKLADFECSILEKVHDRDPMVLSVREEHWIRKFNVKYKGMNKNRS